MNVGLVKLNVIGGTKPYTCFSCRPTLAHHRETGRKLVHDLLDLHIIKGCGESRSEWCARHTLWRNPGEYPWHYVWSWISRG